MSEQPNNTEVKPDEEPSGESTMIIGGVDVKDMMAAYEALPGIQKWGNTATEIITELHDTIKGLRGIANERMIRIADLEARCKELEPDEPETDEKRAEDAAQKGQPSG